MSNQCILLDFIFNEWIILLIGSGPRGANRCERGGNGGVRGRQNRGEILVTKPKGITSQGKMGKIILSASNLLYLIIYCKNNWGKPCGY